jgi:hypothetical protein
MYIIGIVHLVGIKKVSEVIQNARIENFKILDFLFGPHRGTYVSALTKFATHFDLFFILVII